MFHRGQFHLNSRVFNYSALIRYSCKNWYIIAQFKSTWERQVNFYILIHKCRQNDLIFSSSINEYSPLPWHWLIYRVYVILSALKRWFNNFTFRVFQRDIHILFMVKQYFKIEFFCERRSSCRILNRLSGKVKLLGDSLSFFDLTNNLRENLDQFRSTGYLKEMFFIHLLLQLAFPSQSL